MGNRGSRSFFLSKSSWITLEEGEFLFQEGGLGGVAQGFDGGQAEVGGEFAQLGLEAHARFEGADDMAAQDMPEGDAEFARHGHGGFVAAAACGHRQAPLLQRVVDLQESFGRLDEEGAQGSAAMTL